MDDHCIDLSGESTATIHKHQLIVYFFSVNSEQLQGIRTINKCMKKRLYVQRSDITVVQSLQTPPKPQGPSSGEQQGGYKKIERQLSRLQCENIVGDGESNLRPPPNQSSDTMLRTSPSKTLRCQRKAPNDLLLYFNIIFINYYYDHVALCPPFSSGYQNMILLHLMMPQLLANNRHFLTKYHQ